MFKGDRNFSVGLFVSIAIAAFIFFVVWLTGRSGTEEMARYSLLFERDISGLAVGGPVKYMGMNIGSVVRMELEQNDSINVRVDIEILESTPIDSGTYASLALQGITGVAVVNLASEPGMHEPLGVAPGREHPLIPVRVTGFSAIMSSMPAIMEKLDALLTQAGEILGEDNQASISGALEDVQSLTSALAENRDTIAALPADLRATLAEVRQTIGGLQSTIEEAQPDIDAIMENLNRSSENLASMTGRLDALLAENQGEVDAFIADGLGEVPALMQDARSAMRELEKLLNELRKDPSQFIHRPPVEEVEIDP